MVSRSAAAAGFAGAAAILPVILLVGRLTHSSTPILGPLSPANAVALILLSVSFLGALRLSAVTTLAFSAAAISAISLLPLGIIRSTDEFGTSTALFEPMSVWTSLGILSVSLSFAPPIRGHRRLGNLLCTAAMLLCGIVLMSYAYGNVDLTGLSIFTTLTAQPAAAIFLLAAASIIARTETNDTFAATVANSEVGRATRRQLLTALGAPLIAWAVLHYFRDSQLGVGTSLAIFVGITTTPLVWLILRDGRRLSDLNALRLSNREMARAHTAELESQLSKQATQLEQQGSEQIRLAREAKSHSDNRYRILFQSIDAGFCIIEMKFDESGQAMDYRFLEINRAFEGQTGLRDAPGRWMRDMVPEHEQHWFDRYGEITKSQTATRFEMPAKGLDDRWYEVHAFPVDEAALKRVGILFNDITAKRRAAEALLEANATLEARVEAAVKEREEVRAALQQSQKMEAVGQLTGGLAHDFNNLLQGITGSLELLHSRVTQGRINDAERYVAAAQNSARRAAALTHRLLAFSRQQTLEPKTTDVNRLIAGMEELIRRTMSPQITIENIAAGGLWNTLVDPSQLENALLNLCINARDAMPDGGRLIIETGNKWLDESTAQQRDLPAGQYVTMCVSDNGCGMPPEVIARAFDPFFTTKPLGMGTGLGLSMIYGFAKQSGGQVRIYSEVGQGSMLCLWLPRDRGEAVEGEPISQWRLESAVGRSETVLIVDDEPTVRMLIKDVLDELGYHCVEASDGASALKVLQSSQRIDLLITDVGLPGGMNGRQVADAARVARPSLTILFITGFAENAALSHGHLPLGMHILTKPFRMDSLANRIQTLMSECATRTE